MSHASASWAFRVGFLGLLGVASGGFVLACEDMNRPMAVPHSEPRNTCFSDVECASNKKCIKGPQEIRGWCADPREAASAAAGEGASDGGAPAPSAPAPGDAGGSSAPAPGEVKL